MTKNRPALPDIPEGMFFRVKPPDSVIGLMTIQLREKKRIGSKIIASSNVDVLDFDGFVSASEVIEFGANKCLQNADYKIKRAVRLKEAWGYTGDFE